MCTNIKTLGCSIMIRFLFNLFFLIEEEGVREREDGGREARWKGAGRHGGREQGGTVEGGREARRQGGREEGGKAASFANFLYSVCSKHCVLITFIGVLISDQDPDLDPDLDLDPEFESGF